MFHAVNFKMVAVSDVSHLAFKGGWRCPGQHAAISGKWQFGKFIYAPVGATNVGSMAFVFDKKLHTNIQEDDVLLTGSKVTKNLDCPVTFLPGDEVPLVCCVGERCQGLRLPSKV